MSERTEIQFIKPCRRLDEGHREITPEYALSCLKKGKVVQINLDNCSIQRMQELPVNPSMADAENVGLLPLVNILETIPVISLTAIGLNEMPDKHVADSIRGYQNFCNNFWPGHKDDRDATYRIFNKDSTDRRVSFKDLSDEARCVYGMPYVAMLQIQNIKINYSERTPEEQFDIYVHSMISFIDLINAFEVEIAKYAFWKISSNDLNRMPYSIQNRRRDIVKNFTKTGSNIDKCRYLAFDAAMDLHWLGGSNFADETGVTLDLHGITLKADNWVGTNDKKLFNICQDIHWIHHEDSNMKALAVTRESELYNLRYWKYVDQIAEDITKYRKNRGYNDLSDLLDKIDSSVEHIENDLDEYFRINTGVN